MPGCGVMDSRYESHLLRKYGNVEYTAEGESEVTFRRKPAEMQIEFSVGY